MIVGTVGRCGPAQGRNTPLPRYICCNHPGLFTDQQSKVDLGKGSFPREICEEKHFLTVSQVEWFQILCQQMPFGS